MVGDGKGFENFRILGALDACSIAYTLPKLRLAASPKIKQVPRKYT